jgi:DNA replication and repair protein RecF
MRLTALKLQHFRNHLNSSFEFGGGTNVLLGDNGQGKTNVIEAISYLCLTKSFYANSDAYVLNFGKEIFEVEGIFNSQNSIEHHVRVAYDGRQSQKVVIINKHRLEPFSSVIGKFPVVICSPEHAPITMGGPGERRKFIDFVISQSSGVYFQDLLEYRRVLKQRNKVLFDAKTSRIEPSLLLESWDEQLIRLGALVIRRRQLFVREFQEFITTAYHHLVGTEEEPTIEYKPLVQISDESTEMEIQGLLRTELSEKSWEEKKTGTTLVGPHRDEIVFKINRLDLRKYASQGQHKTFLIALKVGEFFYLNERCNETPILLLDDVFSELDEHRAEQLLHFVGDISQTFITSTNARMLDGTIVFGERNKKFFIQNGTSIEQKPFATA